MIPRALYEMEVAHTGITDLRVVDSMHDRKAMMADLSDGFIALPGAMGTLEELFEVLTWAQLGFHEKPCGLLEVAGYFESLIAFLDHAVAERFLREEYRQLLMVEEAPETLLDRFAGYRPVKLEKWIERSELSRRRRHWSRESGSSRCVAPWHDWRERSPSSATNRNELAPSSKELVRSTVIRAPSVTSWTAICSSSHCASPEVSSRASGHDWRK